MSVRLYQNNDNIFGKEGNDLLDMFIGSNTRVVALPFFDYILVFLRNHEDVSSTMVYGHADGLVGVNARLL